METKKEKRSRAKSSYIPPDTKIRRLFIASDWKQKEVAIKLGLPPAAMNKIVKGTSNFTLTTLKKMCVLLGKSPNDLLDWEHWQNDHHKKFTLDNEQ